jgi:hypothetical protein
VTYLMMIGAEMCGMSLSGPIFASCTAARNRSVGPKDPPRRSAGLSPVIVRVHRAGRVEGLAQLGRILQRRLADVLGYFDHHTSQGPSDAINGRLETLHRNALGFRNLTHHRIRSLLHCGDLTHRCRTGPGHFFTATPP